MDQAGEKKLFESNKKTSARFVVDSQQMIITRI